MKILGIGKNYVSELSRMPEGPVEPVVFLKADTTFLTNGEDLTIPEVDDQIWYEIEIAVRIGKSCKAVSESEALEYIDAITLGNDLTAKAVLAKSRDSKGPWAMAKGFDGATPIGNFRPVENYPDIQNINFSMELNGQVVQEGNSSCMITSVASFIAYVSKFMTLNPGDILLTGTPADGAGYVHSGDKMVGYLEGEKVLATNVK